MLRTRNLSISALLADDVERQDDQADGKRVEMGVMGGREVSASTSASIEGVTQGSLRSNIRELRGLYGDAYFGLGTLPSESQNKGNIQQASAEAIAMLQQALKRQDAQRNYSYYDYSNPDQMDELSLLFGREMALYPNIKTAVRDINEYLSKQDR